jgi:RNA-directed DNA polymerase
MNTAPLFSQKDLDDLPYCFNNLETVEDLAILLEVKLDLLVYYAHGAPDAKKYCTFQIKKRSSGLREISAPIGGLKLIQQKLNCVLSSVYKVKHDKPSAHGFLHDRSIVTNAKVHCNKRWLLNLDLLDFFPSIHYGRIRGMFMSPWYKLPAEVAELLANLCCFKGVLPQGAPTSPIISNIICGEMDDELFGLAKHRRCHYTRYADDITFSTSNLVFPPELATIDTYEQVRLGAELLKIIDDNGFRVNLHKLRLQRSDQHQEVTGLITNNEKPNVSQPYMRQIRAMLHAWEKYGLENAEQEFLSEHDTKYRLAEKGAPHFPQVLRGKIEFLGMVRGKNDRIYQRYCRQLSALDPTFVVPVLHKDLRELHVWTEGKTDWKHLEAALRALREEGQFVGLPVEFDKDETTRGWSVLLDQCEHVAKVKPKQRLEVFIFDRDVAECVKRAAGENGRCKNWGNDTSP